MIHENSPVTNTFVSVPAEMGLNCAAFNAGIIAGILDSARFVSRIGVIFLLAFDVKHQLFSDCTSYCTFG